MKPKSQKIVAHGKTSKFPGSDAPIVPPPSRMDLYRLGFDQLIDNAVNQGLKSGMTWQEFVKKIKRGQYDLLNEIESDLAKGLLK